MGHNGSPDSSPPTAVQGVDHQFRAAFPERNALFDIGARTLAEVSLPGFQNIIQQLSSTKTNDVQSVAASQISLLVGYHEIVLAQSRRSFTWALIGAGAGLAFFMIAAGLALSAKNALGATLAAISGAVVEIVAGVVFYLYGKTTSQLGDFHGRLEKLQRYLLANSICESLGETERDKARADLIREIAQIAPRASAG